MEKNLSFNTVKKPFLNSAFLLLTLNSYGWKMFKCNICVQEFSRKKNLLRHERIYTGKNSYKCNKCDKAFINMVILWDVFGFTLVKSLLDATIVIKLSRLMVIFIDIWEITQVISLINSCTQYIYSLTILCLYSKASLNLKKKT